MVAKCNVEAIRAVNEIPDDLNWWGIMQIFVVFILRSACKEDRGGVSLYGLVGKWRGGQRHLWQEVMSKRASTERDAYRSGPN